MRPVFTLLFLSIFFFASAQSTFKTRVFPSNESYLTQVIQLGDGSFVSLGRIKGNGGDMWLVKTTAGGSVLASVRMGTDGDDEGYSIIQTTDGGFAVAGTLNDQTGVLKFKADLTLEWQQEYDISGGYSGALQLVQTADGGYLLAGAVTDSTGVYAGSLVKTNSQGVISFQKRYFAFNGSFIYAISPTEDGNYAFLASNYGSTVDTMYVGKVMPDGTPVWVRQFYDATYRSVELTAVAGASDGGIVISGYAETSGGDDRMMMAKMDAGGGLSWSEVLQNTIGGSEAYAILEDRDGGYLFTGYGYDADNDYAYVVKTSSAGALVWEKTFEPDSEGYTEFTDLKATADGGYITCGDGYLPDGTGDYDDAGILYKFNSSFEGCGGTSGTAGGSLVSFGAVRTVLLVQSNAALASVASNISLTTIGDETVYSVCNALPVAFTSFTAALQGKSVSINWTTANEVNTDHFVVERSADRTSFTTLQTTAAKGNSSLTQTYAATDLQPLPGTSYYRLKEVDKDGKVTYSSIVPVMVMSNGTVVISPNPVQGVMHVIVQSTTNNNFTLQVVDMKGNVLAMQTKAVSTGRNEIDIAASSLTKGVYILKVTDSKTTQAIRFVKE